MSSTLLVASFAVPLFYLGLRWHYQDASQQCGTYCQCTHMVLGGLGMRFYDAWVSPRILGISRSMERRDGNALWLLKLRSQSFWGYSQHTPVHAIICHTLLRLTGLPSHCTSCSDGWICSDKTHHYGANTGIQSLPDPLACPSGQACPP